MVRCRKTHQTAENSRQGFYDADRLAGRHFVKKIFPNLKGVDAADDNDAKPGNKNMEITVGQSDSLLLVSDSTEAIEKVLSRQAGGAIPPLLESPTFQADYGPRLRESPIYLWVSAKTIVDMLTKAPAGADDQATATAARMDMIFSAIGLANITSASLSYQGSPEGTLAQLFLTVPEEKRPPLLKIIAADPRIPARRPLCPPMPSNFCDGASTWSAVGIRCQPC